MPPTRLLLEARAQQQPEWASMDDLKKALRTLASSPALVDAAVCRRLRTELAAVARGEAKLLQLGDCAERFADATPARIHDRAAHLHELADAWTAATGLPTIRMGRMAGQYAKPRSQPTETLPDGTVLPVYRGDAVNSPEPTAAARRPDALRLLHAYRHARTTLSILWERDLGLTGAHADPAAAPRPPVDEGPLPTYAAHEALLLEFEHALVRPLPDGGVYGSSAHYLWIGERTRQLDHEHIRLAARVENPVGVKIGPGAAPGEVLDLVRTLDPRGEDGRLSLIVRMGSALVGERLGPVLDALGDRARHVVWVCDPMHGNTRVNGAGQKSRAVSDIRAEIAGCHRALAARGLPLGGLMLEASDHPVTECVAERAQLAATEPLPRYESVCDPRLDPDQAREVIAYAAGLR
ncbi:3-deoxy-7-phosphoheptulonate synthase [Streptomyces yaizuensis]|uniref:Phospho-2-dehydro-3-deoxyheptonate aldolase n=1 Tax=Streptomyces yaizuensis TaxID=2989713 RepID=A0ABQ5P355_9ACTN|nr:3-deoxy-7-phosphoheptulonate synthase [Streptomyces sp. YSPA8]GLF97031.1 3-deoxy-7-phosphoheptulonate synthase [Streptomyces sp. YSPA8]